jgi:cobalt/nickel transport system permease protein
MSSIENSLFNIGYLERLSYQSTPIHRLDPRAKLLTSMVFIVAVVSFPKYAVGSLIPFILYPVALMALGNVPVRYLGKKILIAVPFAFFIGIFNPLLDRQVMVHLGPLAISGGWVSFTSIMLRFVLTVSVALILVAVSGFYQVCFAMERALRTFDRRGMGFGAYSSMLGHLLLRTLDRAQRLHLAMLSRGFDGEIRVLRPLRLHGRDVAFFLGWSSLFVLLRFYNVSHWLGAWLMELLK